jgi:hypothetical protein
VARGNNMRYIALNRPQFFGSLACGMCFKVSKVTMLNYGIYHLRKH